MFLNKDDSPIRERKKKKTDKSLDEEAYKQKTRKEFVTPEDFFCFRCNIEKKSRYNYEWTTRYILFIFIFFS
jgi:hypothetical protein